MPLSSEKYAPLVRDAVAHYWRTLNKQEAKQRAGKADHGRRSAVTGGKQMDGFCEVVQQVLLDSGMTDAEIYLNKKLQLPGYFRATKKWDMLVVSRGFLVAAMEFKSHRGPSFGNNCNNRTEESVGTANDLWIAYREGAFGKGSPRPWIGTVMLLEECPGSLEPVKVFEPHFSVFPEFKGASYAKRYELLLQKLVMERLYDGAAFLLATEKNGPKGIFSEPAKDLTMRAFLAGLAGQIGVHLANR